MSELDSLDGYFEISHSRESTPAEELAAAVEERNYPVAYSTLRRLDGLLSGWDARDCLTGALSCTPRLFGAILECCEPGEYAATDISVPYPERQDRQLLVSGTLLTLAAAMDRPEHMAILLEKGWDINSAAPASEQALYDMYNPMMFQETGWRRPDSEIRCCAREGDDAETVPEWQILRATPLAAAVVAGSLGAVRLLRSRGGVKGTEHPAVSCAAAEAMHGTRRQRECLRLALGLRSRTDDTDGMTCGHVTTFSSIEGEWKGFMPLLQHFPKRSLLTLQFLFSQLLRSWNVAMDRQGQLPSCGHRTRWKEPGGPHPAWAACLPLGCHETEEEASALLGPLCLRTYCNSCVCPLLPLEAVMLPA